MPSPRCKRRLTTAALQMPRPTPRRWTATCCTTVGAAPCHATPTQMMQAVAQVAREQLSRRWVAGDMRRPCRPGAPGLLPVDGVPDRPHLVERVGGAGTEGRHGQAARDHAPALEDLVATEPDAALGNGGLGRLAACFLDSMATLELPSFGYGIRYEFGMFKPRASTAAGRSSTPDPWLEDGTPWEFPRSGRALHGALWRLGRARRRPEPGADLAPCRRGQRQGLRHGHPRPRHRSASAPCGCGKRWPRAHIDLHAFNTGDYARAAEFKNQYENISWVLYPNDSTPAGRELRLRQEYFFTSASIQDILARHLAEHGRLTNLSDKVAIHLNDTHPAIGVAELMRAAGRRTAASAWARRLGRDQEGLQLHQPHPDARGAGNLAGRPDAAGAAAPSGDHLPHQRRIPGRRRTHTGPATTTSCAGCRLIDESGNERRVRMAHLSIVGSHKVNGVSALHSDSAGRRPSLPTSPACGPTRFTNMTNGVTPRRWLAQANPSLSSLIDSTIGSGWRLDLDQLGAAGAACRTRRLPQGLHGRQARQQGAAGRRTSWSTTGVTVDPPASSTCRSSASMNTSASC